LECNYIYSDINSPTYCFYLQSKQRHIPKYSIIHSYPFQDIWFIATVKTLIVLFRKYLLSLCYDTDRGEKLGQSSRIRKQHTPWLLVRKRTVPTEGPPLVSEF
jgi:hypothetical protein